MQRAFNLCLLISLFSFALTTVSAQEMTKEEKKQWKQVAKQYSRDLQGLKTLVEEHDYFKDRAQSMEGELSQARADVDAKDRQISAYQEQIADLNTRLLAAETAAQAQPDLVSRTGTPTTGQSDMMGIVFRVQIGAFEKTKMDANMATGDNMTVEQEGGLQRITVGNFRSHADAIGLRDRLRAMGVKDAFVVGYRDGQRIDVNEAIRAAGQSQR